LTKADHLAVLYLCVFASLGIYALALINLAYKVVRLIKDGGLEQRSVVNAIPSMIVELGNGLKSVNPEIHNALLKKASLMRQKIGSQMPRLTLPLKPLIAVGILASANIAILGMTAKWVAEEYKRERVNLVIPPSPVFTPLIAPKPVKPPPVLRRGHKRWKWKASIASIECCYTGYPVRVDDGEFDDDDPTSVTPPPAAKKFIPDEVTSVKRISDYPRDLYLYEVPKLGLPEHTDVDATVDPSGRVVVNSVSPGLDRALEDAVRRAAERTKFQPQTRNGKPENGYVSFRINWRSTN